MQLDEPSYLRKLIVDRFGSESLNGSEVDLLAPPYRGNDDAFEMARDFRDRKWQEIPAQTLFVHREMLFALSPSAYRAALAAVLCAILDLPENDVRLGDLVEYALYSMSPGTSEASRTSFLARLNSLDDQQRDVVARTFKHLHTRWRLPGLDNVLAVLNHPKT